MNRKTDLLNKYVQKSRTILRGQSNHSLKVLPWNHNKIKRAREWFGNNEKVQQIISDYYKIDK